MAGKHQKSELDMAKEDPLLVLLETVGKQTEESLGASTGRGDSKDFSESLPTKVPCKTTKSKHRKVPAKAAANMRKAGNHSRKGNEEKTIPPRDCLKDPTDILENPASKQQGRRTNSAHEIEEIVRGIKTRTKAIRENVDFVKDVLCSLIRPKR